MATYHFPKILCFILIFFCQTIIADDSFTTVRCKNSVTGIHNHRTVLACECKSNTSIEKCNSTWFDISGSSNVVEIPCTSDQKTNAQNRKRCLTSLKNASLIIEKTEILDIGKYQFFLDCGLTGYAKADVELLVKGLECSTTEKVYRLPEQKIRAFFGVTSSLGFIMFLTLMCSLIGGIKYFKHLKSLVQINNN
ncbi:uncharacterized protein LOC144699731 isoform X2 [Cetorhinus maximus]